VGRGFNVLSVDRGQRRPNPMQSRKMTARLQVATASDRRVLLRTSARSGHGHGTAASEGIEQSADVFAFLFAELGIVFRN